MRHRRRSLGDPRRRLGRPLRGAFGFGIGALVGAAAAWIVHIQADSPGSAADVALSALVGGLVVGTTAAVTAETA